MRSSSAVSLRSQRDSICRSCLLRLTKQSRNYAAAATAESTQPSPEPDTPSAAQQSKARKAYQLKIAPVISRPPLLTRDLTPFEKAYYLYQKRLNERLALPPTRYFYYPKGTPSDLEWKRKVKARKTAARDVGIYNAYGKEGWQDEVLLGDKTSEPENIIESLYRDAEGRAIVGAKLADEKKTSGSSIAGDPSLGEGTAQKQSQLERPMPRVTEADQKNDIQSLDRKLDRSLYLLVQTETGAWRFPEDDIMKESLYQATERILVQALGINMNTWVVGNHPIGHFSYDYPEPREMTTRQRASPDAQAQQVQKSIYGGKVFFMKTRIMAGQADVSKNPFGYKNFAWLAKEEVAKHVTGPYWTYIKNMLTDR